MMHFLSQSCTEAMSNNPSTTVSLTEALAQNLQEKAITRGVNEVNRERTLSLHAQQMATGAPRPINFRGDVADKHQYDKIKSLSAAKALGNVVVVLAESHKTGQTAHYQILANQWGLLEVVACLD